jgi:hypothetical protein
MKEYMWGYMLIALGLVIITIIVLVQNITTTQEEDYYLTREILEASMIDALDYGTFRSTGEVAMIKEKFVEVFIRRFAESVSGTKDYTLEFYDINEIPPKATVRVLTNSGDVTVSENAEDFNVDLNTFMTGILETTGDYLTDRSKFCRERDYEIDDSGEKVKVTVPCDDNTNCQSNLCG